MRAFVTGSTGLLGRSLIPLLLDRGLEVRALARSPEQAANLVGVEVVPGDLQRTADFRRELRGCDVLFHLAAYYREYIRDRSQIAPLWKLNVSATTELLGYARDAGIRNVVYVSSAGVVSLEGEPPPDESAAYDASPQDRYFASKIAAERAIDEFLCRCPEMRVIIVRPSLMLGPDDRSPTPCGQFILNVLNQRIPVVLPGRMVLVAVASMMLALAWMLGRTAPVTPSALRRMRRMVAPRTDRARATLSFTPRPVEQTVADTVAWFSTNPDVTLAQELSCAS